VAEATVRRILSVQAFSKALIDAGIIPDDASVRRLVIDVDADKAGVIMYLEQWADERLLQVVPTLDGVEIRSVAKEPEHG
jgi:hypothetical protein